VSIVPVALDCPAPLGVIDRFDLWRWGTHAVNFDDGGVSITTVAEARGRRPWSPGRRETDPQ
jgi:competence protein ComEC